MSECKSFVAFLSFSEPDEPLARAIQHLFLQLGDDYDCFFAPVKLYQSQNPNWPDDIIKGIRASHCFVPIYTHHSLRRPWVLYESGVADSLKLPRYPVRVSNVSVDDINSKVPSRTRAQVFAIYEKDKLIEFATNVCLSSLPKLMQKKMRDLQKDRVRSLVARSKDARQILRLARQRWVFIAGNTPRDQYKRTHAIKWARSDKRLYDRRLKSFAKKLTVALLEQGFSISSCPQVEPVGKIVCAEAANWLAGAKSKTLSFSDYRIGGIYPIDRHARESKLPRPAQKVWLDRLMDFRRSYLTDQEWLLLIGGSEGTEEEHKAAKKVDTLKIYAVPCFGGAAMKIWDKMPFKHKGPCLTCKTRNGNCNLQKLHDLVRYIKEKH